MDKRFLKLIEDSIILNWDKPALTDLGGNTYTYQDFACEIKQLHLLFDELNLSAGDKVALCGKNSSHWAIAFFATLSYGAVAVNILHDFHPDGITDIVNHSEATIFFADQATREKITRGNMPALKHLMSLESLDIAHPQHPTPIDKQKVFSAKYPRGIQKENLHFYIESSETLAILNYTSGTTSNPKGVMLPYRSLWSNTQFAIDRLSFILPGDHILCMLPMAHMYGLAFEILLGISKGCHIHFLTKVPSPAILIEAFANVKPSLVLAVPLIIEKIINNKVFPELEKQPTKTLLKLPGIKNIILNKVKNKLTQTFGGNIKELIIGGAALNQQVAQFLKNIHFPATVGYGMTECGPLISYASWKEYQPGSCGKVVDRMTVRINSDNPTQEVGEILVKGDNLMLGYYKNEEATQEVFTSDGWLKTGDLATINKDGMIFIRGRNKSLILGASGQNIYPEEIEEKFNSQKYILESLVVDRNKKLVILIVPDHENLNQDGISSKQHDEIFSQIIKNTNRKLPTYSQIHSYELQSKEFAKTPKRSIRRFQYQ